MESGQKWWGLDSVKVKRKGRLESYWGLGWCLMCDGPPSWGGESSLMPESGCPPPTAPQWDRAPFLEHLWHTTSGPGIPLNKDKVRQKGLAWGSPRCAPFGGNGVREKETPASVTMPLFPCWGHTPHLLPLPGVPKPGLKPALPLSTARKAVNREISEQGAHQLPAATGRPPGRAQNSPVWPTLTSISHFQLTQSST